MPEELKIDFSEIAYFPIMLFINLTKPLAIRFVLCPIHQYSVKDTQRFCYLGFLSFFIFCLGEKKKKNYICIKLIDTKLLIQ